VTQYFADRLSATGALATLSDLLTFIATGSWFGTQFCDLSMLVFAEIMRIGAQWSGLDLPLFQKLIETMFNDPDSDWSILCDECFWQLDQLLGSNYSETYWVATCGVVYPAAIDVEDCSPSQRGVIVNITLPTISEIKDVTLFSRWNGVGDAGIGRITLFDDGDAVLQNVSWNLTPYVGSEYESHKETFNQEDVKRVKLELIASFDPANQGYVKTNQTILNGRGDDPFA
jgi:hypothetical protein